ncbi:MAG: coiled-coil domain-containing protein, partial [Sulfurihydrogenibium sp.]|uniref:coiled-coil domain-containing protein n=1 Tax=Sulfurihydrogenibium sp. TaxID=2053621 RepID=UPI003D0F8C5F
MDIDKLVEKIKDAITGELRSELNLFKAEVSSQLKGFSLAIESMNARLNNVENDIRSLRQELIDTRTYLDNKIENVRDELSDKITHLEHYLNLRIDETNKRIDETNKRIDETNKRIDETNKRIDS